MRREIVFLLVALSATIAVAPAIGGSAVAAEEAPGHGDAENVSIRSKGPGPCALRFDSLRRSVVRVDPPRDSALRLDRSFTLEAWISLEKVAGYNTDLIGFEGGWRLWLGGHTNILYFDKAGKFGKLNVGRWTHVAVSCDARGEVVLCPLAILKEDASKWNPKCDQYADITRNVAADTGSTLVDLRAAVKAFMRNEGTELAPDGTLVFRRKLLTYDGVHLNARGCEVVADLISRGICKALQKQP